MNMTKEERKVKALRVNELLKQEFPDVIPPLNHRNAFELLVATVLSAQCTDARVNQVTPKLFEKYPSAAALAAADVEELKQIIFSLGFYNEKAKRLIALSTKIISDHSGEVPSDMDELTKLPGVARKTANVVLGQWFKKNTGITVDTHVIRCANRLGLTNSTNPVVIERDLMELIPQNDWADFSLRLVFHGRKTCTARNPNCKNTIWKDYCSCYLL